MKQIIIARKDLNMSPGKLAAQVSHASMAFLTTQIRNNTSKYLTVTQHWAKRTVHDIVDGKIHTITKDEPAMFRRGDLSEWAEQAFKDGKDVFYTKPIDPSNPYGVLELCEPEYEYRTNFKIDSDIYDGWILGAFTKVVCEAKNKNQLLKAKDIADEMFLHEGIDYFLIKDNCYTELEPEETDENGVGRTLTCIGFKPLPDDIAEKISKKFQLYK